jgi:hypothetical protein
MNERKDVEELLSQHGGKLVRQKKHHVWKLPDGRIFVMAATPGDIRAERNNMANLYNFLGVEKEIIKNPDRRPKPGVGRPKPASTAGDVKLRDWKSELLKVRLFKPKQSSCVGYQLVPVTPLTVILRHLLWN